MPHQPASSALQRFRVIDSTQSIAAIQQQIGAIRGSATLGNTIAMAR